MHRHCWGFYFAVEWIAILWRAVERVVRKTILFGVEMAAHGKNDPRCVFSMRIWTAHVARSEWGTRAGDMRAQVDHRVHMRHVQ